MSLLPKLRDVMERRGMSRHSITAYIGYVRNLWRWAKVVSPQATSLRDIRDPQWIEIFDRLRTVDRYSAGSISGHMCALKLTFDAVYRQPLHQIDGLDLPRRSQNIRTLPHAAEISAIFERLRGVPRVVLSVILGSGSRIEETCMLRVHQIDLIGGLIIIKRGKGNKDRWVRLAPSLIEPLRRYLDWRRLMWDADCAAGFGEVDLPDALSRKYRSAPREWEWQWLFPSQIRHEDSGRWYISPKTVQRAMSKARRDAGIYRRITPHHLRHAHATALKRAGVDTVDIATLLGHADVETTKAYIHADDVRQFRLPDVFADILQAPDSAHAS